MSYNRTANTAIVFRLLLTYEIINSLIYSFISRDDNLEKTQCDFGVSVILRAYLNKEQGKIFFLEIQPLF